VVRGLFLDIDNADAGFSQKTAQDSLVARARASFTKTAFTASCEKQGTAIPTNDIWIAALVLRRSLVLCAREVHF
jgi:predicted nucleic acid-binding protein